MNAFKGIFGINEDVNWTVIYLNPKNSEYYTSLLNMIN